MYTEELFEYPLPVLKTDIDKIAHNISGLGEGYINIKNIGGGVLKGYILSNTECIVFSENEFFSNDLKLRYEINTSSYSAGDRIMSNVIIISTGGEFNIPVIINVMPKPFITENNNQIFSIKEFYSYAKNNPIDARRILVSNDFMLWLKLSGFEHMDVLEEIVNDSNKERALDNFFILSGIKKKSGIVSEQSVFEYKIKNSETEVLTGTVKIKKNARGYINAVVYKKEDKPWLRVFCEKLNSKGFDKNYNAEIYFEIDTKLVDKNFDEEEIIIESDKKVSIKIRAIKVPKIKVWLEKQCYDFEDEGKLLINNFSGEHLVFEVKANDSFIKFDGEKYFVNEKAAIPFKIKTAAFTKNRLDFQKKPFIEGNINIKTIIGKEKFSFDKKIIVGTELI